MRRTVMLAILLVGLSALNAATPQDPDARALELIRILNLKVLPRESGYLGLIGQSAQKITVGSRKLALQS